MGKLFVLDVYKRQEEGVVPQPVDVFAAKGEEARLIGLLFGPLVGGAQHPLPVLVDAAVVHLLGVVSPVGGRRLFWAEETLLRQGVQVDEIGVAGKGRKGLVGGVPVDVYKRQPSPLAI